MSATHAFVMCIICSVSSPFLGVALLPPKGMSSRGQTVRLSTMATVARIVITTGEGPQTTHVKVGWRVLTPLIAQTQLRKKVWEASW